MDTQLYRVLLGALTHAIFIGTGAHIAFGVALALIEHRNIMPVPVAEGPDPSNGWRIGGSTGSTWPQVDEG